MRWRTALKLLVEPGLAALAALAVLLPASPLNMPLAWTDSGVFLYTGWRILDGAVPYRDVWDHKPPLIFYINAAGLALGGGSRWGVWLIELVLLTLAAWLLLRLLTRHFGLPAAILSLHLWASSLLLIIQGGNQTAEYALPLQLASLWVAANADQPGFQRRQAYLIGLLSGLAFFIKQPTVGLGLAIALVLAARRLRAGQRERLAGEALALCAGVLTVAAPIVAYFAAHGALAEFWDAAFGYSFVYSTANWDSRLSSALAGLRQLSRGGLPQLAFIGYGVALLWARFGRLPRPEWTALVVVGLIDLPLEVLLVNLSGRPFVHYYITLLPILAVFAGLTFWLVLDRLSRDGIPRAATGALALALMAAFSWALATGYVDATRLFREARDDTAIRYLERTTAPDDSVLVWGTQAAVNFYAQRRSPTRFVYQLPLYQSGYSDEALILEFLDGIARARPRLILDSDEALTPLYEFPVQTPAIEQRIGELQRLYRVRERLGSWTVYEYVGDGAAEP